MCKLCGDTNIETFLHIDIWYVREKEIDCLPKTKHWKNTIQQQLKSIIAQRAIYRKAEFIHANREEKTKNAHLAKIPHNMYNITVIMPSFDSFHLCKNIILKMKYFFYSLVNFL